MNNSIKTDYMNTPNLGYSEYFIKNTSDLNALSPKPGDRALVADSGAVYICIETGEWNKFGNSIPGGEVVIASEINEDSTNDEVAGAAAVWDIVSERTNGVEKVVNKSSTISSSMGEDTYPTGPATYAYGQQIKQEAINAFAGSYLSTSGGNLSGPVNSTSYYSIQSRRDFDFTNTEIYNAAALTRIQGIVNRTITPTSSDLDYYDLDSNGKIDAEDLQLLTWAIEGKIRGEELSETTWKSAYMIRKIVFGADPTRTYVGNEKVWARVVGTYGTIRWMFSDEDSYINDTEHRKAYPYVDVLTLNSGTGGGGESVQSDWEQNDSTAPDYIKNRICYEEEGNTVTIEANEWQQGGESEWIFIGDHSLGLQIGDRPTVVIKKNGQEFTYICEPVQTAQDMPEGVLSTGAAVPEIQDTTETGGNMILYVFDNCLFDWETQEISVGDGFIFTLGGSRPPIAQLNFTNGEEIHQIPSKYIPPMKNYSTTEHLVGTWIDGSPLYEKTYQALITEAGEIDIDVSNENIADCVYFECVGKTADGGCMFTMSGTSNNDIEGIGGYCIDDYLYIDCNISTADKYSITAYVTIRYTKNEGEG